jgi:hypothetical protein
VADESRRGAIERSAEHAPLTVGQIGYPLLQQRVSSASVERDEVVQAERRSETLQVLPRELHDVGCDCRYLRDGSVVRLSRPSKTLLQQLFDGIEPNAVVRDHDLVAALAFAVLADDRRPRLPRGTRRRIEQDALEIRQVGSGCSGEPRTHFRGRHDTVAGAAVARRHFEQFWLRLRGDAGERRVLSPGAYMLSSANGVLADVGCDAVVIRTEVAVDRY